MKTKSVVLSALGLWIFCYAYSVISSDVAEKVIAGEISGIVVEKASGKPVANAVVAIRFERYNTGHGSPQCFGSIAAETDADGRFRFEPWTLENTGANSFLGQITAYKAGYDMQEDSEQDIWPARRSFLGIRFSDNLRITKTERRLELRPHSDTEMERMKKLRQTFGRYLCSPVVPNNKFLLQHAIQNEILMSPLSDKATGGGYTYKSWTDDMLKSYGR